MNNKAKLVFKTLWCCFNFLKLIEQNRKSRNNKNKDNLM